MKSTDDPLAKAFLACRDGLIRSILKMSVKPADVDDILQETFLRALRSNEKKRIESPQGYLFVVSRNLVLERLSRRSREISIEIDEAQLDSGEIPADVKLHDRQKLERFNDALSGLSAEKRQAILLRKFYGFSHNEIAKKMGVSVSAVEKYIASGVRECRRLLMKQGYEFDDQTKESPEPRRGSSADRGAES